MRIVADLHIHSSFSRATSRDIRPETLHQWAQRKGIHILGTGDCTHPQWLGELEEKLEPAEEGLWRLKPDLAREADRLVPPSCHDLVRFVFQAEISTIYKKCGRTRKVHHLVLLPEISAVRKLNARLSRIGNLKSDGRPILGLDSRDLLETVLEACENAIFIPAHIWTPWFSVLGSKSGFDAIEECYDDLRKHITGVETGLSSDPAMNWRVSRLDSLQLVSNSDAHSPSKLGREANLLDISLTFTSLRQALRTGEGLLGTIEFFPEEGKYHLDGHRKCEVRLEPTDTRRYKGLCPVCNRPLTIGVMNRVVELGDRASDYIPKGAKPFFRLLPLAELLSEILGCGTAAQRVQRLQQQLLERWGPELRILRELPAAALEEARIPLLPEGFKRMREGQVFVQAGFDGQYGKISLFTKEERDHLQGQRRLLIDMLPISRPASEVKQVQHTEEGTPALRPAVPTDSGFAIPKSDGAADPNATQEAALLHDHTPLLIIAGPGTGKTFTLTHRIAHFLRRGRARPEEIMGVTFTQRAALEMKERLESLLIGKPWTCGLRVQTLHAFGHHFLRKYYGAFGWETLPFLVDEKFRMRLLLDALREECPGISTRGLPTLMEKISVWKQLPPGHSHQDSLISQAGEAYERKLRRLGALDYDDLLALPLRLLEARQDLRTEIHKETKFIFVDEYQDLNPLQISLLKRLFEMGGHITAIGDPDQSIYGFRGANANHFADFPMHFPGATILRLVENYRSTRSIVNAAMGVISKNSVPYPRTLISRREQGHSVFCHMLETDKAEAIFIAHEINRLMGGISHWAMERSKDGALASMMDISFGDVAVLYRLHALRGPLEDALSREGIPYQCHGDKALRNNETLQDLLAGIRFLLEPCRNENLLRTLTIRTIGLSAETIAGIRVMAENHPGELWERLLRSTVINGVDPREATRLQRQIRLLQNVLDESHHARTSQVVRHLVSCLRIHMKEPSPSWNLGAEIQRQFITLADHWEGDLLALQDFWSLQEELDLYDPRSHRVSLLSVHAAKGLEFPVVFLAGCEEGLFPYLLGKEKEDLEEERRLFFVAITRAKDLLFLTGAKSRRIWGQIYNNKPSRFLFDIPQSLLMSGDTANWESKRRRAHQLKLF
jgi:DNA helicase-2/ATP-dependent DNA helicase PcrA